MIKLLHNASFAVDEDDNVLRRSHRFRLFIPQQGPPGTGKTHTLVSAIKLLKHHFAVPHPILLSAHTNVAVDNLALAALKAGLNVVKVSPSANATMNSIQIKAVGKSPKEKHGIMTTIDECSLERKMEKHPLYTKFEEVCISIASLRHRIVQIGNQEVSLRQHPATKAAAEMTAQHARDHATTSRARSRSKLSPAMAEQLAALRMSLGRHRQQADMLSRRIHASILYEADVICSTLLSSHSASLRCIDFPLVFIDESTQAQEVLSLVPLMKGARQVALIGDHKQLPPILKSAESKKQGGARSLFERLVEEDGWSQGTGEADRTAHSSKSRTRIQMLQVQHRMHPDLAEFPSKRFYDGRLASAVSTAVIEPVKSTLLSASRQRLLFVDHNGRESISRSALGMSTVSLQNHAEMVLLLHLIVDVLICNQGKAGDGAVSGEQIGVITPYAAQARLISRVLRPATDGDAQRPERRAIEGKLIKAGVVLTELDKIEVNTVDGFQGREKDVIFFSAVRCQTQNTGTSDSYWSPLVGFLADERRLNVALTRAKRACFVLGNLETWSRGRGESGSGIDQGKGTALADFAEHVRSRDLAVSEAEIRDKIPLGLPSSSAWRVGSSEDEAVFTAALWSDILNDHAVLLRDSQSSLPSVGQSPKKFSPTASFSETLG